MELTWALLALAGAVLVGLGLHGWWRARQAARGQGPGPRPERPSRLPVLVDRVDPPMDTVPAPPPAPEPRSAAWRRTPRLDALIDAIVPLALESPASGDFLLSHAPASRRAGSKPFYIEGLDTETGEWEPLQAGRRYSELQAGVQLASRSGPLNEIEYSEFVQALQAFADAVNAMPEVPDMLDVVARARELDAFASPRDAQLALTLRSASVAWSIGFIRQCAARHGFVPGTVPSRLVLPGAAEGEPPVLAIHIDPQAALEEDPQKAAVRSCQLSLDVPQTAASAEPFPAWHNAARKLADDLGADVVDDYGEPITVHAFATIGRELEQLYEQLAARDLAAGSPAARRLFS